MSRGKAPQIASLGATVTTALGSSSTAHGFPEQDHKRRALNEFIRTSGLFDGVIDFRQGHARSGDAVGSSPNSCPRVHRRSGRHAAHPNRTGYLTMGMAIDLDLFKLKPQAKR